MFVQIRCYAFALILGLCLDGIANPSLTPHLHGDDKVYYEQDGVKDGDSNHNHLFNLDPKTGSIQDNNKVSYPYKAESVWDDRFYRFNRNALLVDTGGLDVFAHGFISPGQEPRYRFIDAEGANTTFGVTQKALFNQAVNIWTNAVMAVSVGKTAPDGSPLVTGFGFREFDSDIDDAFEIRVGFFDNLEEQTGAIGLWVTNASQSWVGGPSQNDIKNGPPIIAFDDDIAWIFDLNKAPGVDEYDFLTIALHEFGHAVGLEHTNAGTKNSLMRSDFNLAATNKNTFREVDYGSAAAGAMLYTQPQAVPEPSAWALFIISVTGLALRRFRR